MKRVSLSTARHPVTDASESVSDLVTKFDSAKHNIPAFQLGEYRNQDYQTVVEEHTEHYFWARIQKYIPPPEKATRLEAHRIESWNARMRIDLVPFVQ